MATLSPPVSPQPVNMERPRAVSAMSYTSTKSHKSNKSLTKIDLVESPRDKKRFGEESKADPTKALNEATPGEIAQQHSNLEDMRGMRFKDQEGNVIADPDRSNPSRPRMERPLDTIRSFNAAAEGTSSRRNSSYGNRPLSQYGSQHGSHYGHSEGSHSRQGSQFSSPGYGPRSYGRQTPSQNGYYRNNSYGFFGHTQGSFDESAEYDQRDYYRPQPPRPGPNMRNMHSDPYYGQYNESPTSGHSHYQSYETMTSGSDENGKSTNPSSLNSSHDQLHTAQQGHNRKIDNYSHNQYNQYNQPAQYENEMSLGPVSPVSPQTPSYNPQRNGSYQTQQGYPAPPPKDEGANGGSRQPIRLNGPPAAASAGAANGSLRKSDSTKRQSWLSRKFSKREK